MVLGIMYTIIVDQVNNPKTLIKITVDGKTK